MIYIQSTIVFQPGKRDLWLVDEKERIEVVDKAGGKRIGSWFTTVGNVNEVTLLVAYDDFAQWQKAAATLRKNTKFQALTKKAQETEVSASNKILSPTPESPLK